jgi:Flp pilus assembly pilin Flp
MWPKLEWVWQRITNEDNWEPAMRKIVAFLKDDSGTETLEWGLVCGLIVVGAITMIALIGPKVTDMWNDMNNAVPAAD